MMLRSKQRKLASVSLRITPIKVTKPTLNAGTPAMRYQFMCDLNAIKRKTTPATTRPRPAKA